MKRRPLNEIFPGDDAPRMEFDPDFSANVSFDKAPYPGKDLPPIMPGMEMDQAPYPGLNRPPALPPLQPMQRSMSQPDPGVAAMTTPSPIAEDIAPALAEKEAPSGSGMNDMLIAAAMAALPTILGYGMAGKEGGMIGAHAGGKGLEVYGKMRADTEKLDKTLASKKVGAAKKSPRLYQDPNTKEIKIGSWDATRGKTVMSKDDSLAPPQYIVNPATGDIVNRDTGKKITQDTPAFIEKEGTTIPEPVIRKSTGGIEDEFENARNEIKSKMPSKRDMSNTPYPGETPNAAKERAKAAIDLQHDLKLAEVDLNKLSLNSKLAMKKADDDLERDKIRDRSRLSLDKIRDRSRFEDAKELEGIRSQNRTGEASKRNELPRRTTGARGGEGAQKPLNASQQARADNVGAALQAIQDMHAALAEGVDTFSLIGDNKFTMAKARFKEALGRMQSGGAIQASEERSFLEMAPTMLDKSAIQQTKLNDMAKEILSRADSLGLSPAQALGRRGKPTPWLESIIGEAAEGLKTKPDVREVPDVNQRVGKAKIKVEKKAYENAKKWLKNPPSGTSPEAIEDIKLIIQNYENGSL